MGFCPHCMSEVEGRFCSRCGGDVSWTAAPGQLPVGTLLRGSDGRTYRIGAARGQGGFGITYVAQDLADGRRVAVKEYYPSQCAMRNKVNQVLPMTGQDGAYGDGLSSFLDEAKMLSTVGALPSVVTVIDYFRANGTAYLIMEFVDGVPLHRVVNQQGKMAAATLLPKLNELLQDLETLHRAGVIHRDISPDNLILMPDGKLKLLDFGSARSVQNGKTMTVLLKAGFSPVEQYQSRGQGPWTDVYALAATIYYCLTGVIPPSAVDRLAEDELKRPSALGVALSPEQEEAILWGLVVQPKSRPAGMEVFRRRLFALGTPVSGPVSQPVSASGHQQTVAVRTPVDTRSDPAPVSSENRTPTHETVISSSAGPSRSRKKSGVGIILLVVFLLAVMLAGGFFTYRMLTKDKASEAGDPIYGESKDGFSYMISADRTECVITGYSGDKTVLQIPEEIEGYTVNIIGEHAFSGNTTLESVLFPSGLMEIEDRAFYGCSNLRDIYVESNCSAGSKAFVGCASLRCAVLGNSLIKIKNWSIPGDFAVYYRNMETGIGELDYVVIDPDGVIYGVTVEERVLVMDVPDSLKEVELYAYVDGDRVEWIYEDALEGMSESSVVWLPPETLFPCELWNAVKWEFLDSGSQYTLAECWLYSCYMCAVSRDMRKTPAMAPDEKLLRAAIQRAQELSRMDSYTRPSGENWSTVLDEYNVPWSYANSYKESYDMSVDNSFIDDLELIAESYTYEVTELGNRYYDHIAVGMYYDPVTKLSYLCAITTMGDEP